MLLVTARRFPKDNSLIFQLHLGSFAMTLPSADIDQLRRHQYRGDGEHIQKQRQSKGSSCRRRLYCSRKRMNSLGVFFSKDNRVFIICLYFLCSAMTASRDDFREKQGLKQEL